jgi:hypothetical protein
VTKSKQNVPVFRAQRGKMVDLSSYTPSESTIYRQASNTDIFTVT